MSLRESATYRSRNHAIPLPAWAVTSFVVFYSLATRFTFSPYSPRSELGTASRFFYAQAKAMLHLRLHVRPGSLPGECFVVGGKCFGYFGIAPSLLRVPSVILGISDTAPFFTAVALTVITVTTYMIISETARSDFLAVAITATLTIGGFLLQLTRVAVYEEAIVWAVCFSLLAFRRWSKWVDNGHWKDFGLTVVFLVLACNSRPSALGFCLGIAVGTVALKRDVWRAVVLLAPIGTSLFVNWLKFGTFVPELTINESVASLPGWLDIIQRAGGHDVSWRFVFSNAVHYLRPDGLSLGGNFPYIDFAFPAHRTFWYLGIKEGSHYIEPMTTATVSYAIPLALGLIGFRKGARQETGAASDEVTKRRALALSGLLMTAPILTNIAVTNRYNGDFYLAVLGVILLVPTLKRDAPMPMWHKAGVLIACAASLWLHLTLTQSWSNVF